MSFAIKKAEIKNLKGLQYIHVDILDKDKNPAKTFYFTGKNGTGKSSAIEMILFAIAGKKIFGIKKKDLWQLIGNFGKIGTSNKLEVDWDEGKTLFADGVKIEIDERIFEVREEGV